MRSDFFPAWHRISKASLQRKFVHEEIKLMNLIDRLMKFPLPLRERVKVRGRILGTPSPHSSPVKGEEVKIPGIGSRLTLSGLIAFSLAFVFFARHGHAGAATRFLTR